AYRQSSVGSHQSQSPVSSHQRDDLRLKTDDARLPTGGWGLATEPARRLRWVALAFVPSSLMLGLTTYLTTDVAPIPLFWVLPLTLYLASFALVFARRAVVPHALMVRLLPILSLVLVTVLVFANQLPPSIQGPLHLVTFFVAAMVCHGELARS